MNAIGRLVRRNRAKQYSACVLYLFNKEAPTASLLKVSRTRREVMTGAEQAGSNQALKSKREGNEALCIACVAKRPLGVTSSVVRLLKRGKEV